MIGFKKFMNRNGWPSKKDSKKIVMINVENNAHLSFKDQLSSAKGSFRIPNQLQISQATRLIGRSV